MEKGVKKDVVTKTQSDIKKEKRENDCIFCKGKRYIVNNLNAIFG